jgi:hypothetical protein
LAAGINALLKLGIIAALLVASSCVAYYYAVYLPGRDARLQQERVLAQARATEEKRAKQDQQAVEQKQAEQHQAEAKAGAETRYATCVDAAGAAHDATWAAECKRLADKAQQDHADCLAKSKLSQQYCDTAYRSRDGSSNCSLPLKVATELDGGLIKARNRCAQERKAALQ